MRIFENIEMLEIAGQSGTLYPVLIWDGTETVLIDTCLPGQIDAINQELSKIGFSVDKITKVIITHQDIDHIGTAKELRGKGAEILAYKDEAPYIDGTKTPVKLVSLEARLKELTPPEKEFYDRLKSAFPNYYTTVDKALSDGDTLPFCGGIEVLHTPGHTPGHMALFLKQSGIIIAGDGANIIDGRLTGANPQFTQDMSLAGLSFEKLKACNPNAIVCYHGGLYNCAK